MPNKSPATPIGGGYGGAKGRFLSLAAAPFSVKAVASAPLRRSDRAIKGKP